MLVRKLTCFPLLIAVAGLASCSGGSPGSGSFSASCADPGAFCLSSCNLGCTTTGGCAITDIAENQPLIFVFSQDVDPRSVDFASVSIKTVTGQEPVGQFVVQGPTVQFIPDVRAVQGTTFYGFAANEVYILSITGGPTAPAALVSTGGDRLPADYSCNLRVTRGVIDLDQRPPSAKLIAPANSNNVPRDTNVVLEFSELIDSSPFVGVSGLEGPVIYRIRRTISDASGVRCDPTSRGVVLAGVPRLQNDSVRGVTIVTFTPAQRLPAESCLEVEVTSRVRDLAGTRASQQIFRAVIESANVQERTLGFGFENDLGIDLERSGGAWGGGNAEFAVLGGDGRHGDFIIQDGSRVSDTYFIWNTDSQTLSRKTSSFLNEEVTVTDGRFYFTNFIVPAGFVAEFRGSNPVQIFVRGECRIEGRVIGNATLVPGTHNGKNSTVQGTTIIPGQGQAGGEPGPGGGRGGAGAWGCDGAGNPNSPTNQQQYNSFNGYNGEDLSLPAGHPYAAQAVGTAGRGAALFPAHGDQNLLLWRGFGVPGTYGIEACAGAGGGGFVQAGGTGTCPEAGGIQGTPPIPNTTPAERGPDAAGGARFPLLTFPPTFTSSRYFLVGGSGGGGGASQPLFSLRNNTTEPFKYRSGGAGGGGGGAFLLRSGGSMALASNGAIEAKGASCEPTSTTFTQGQRGVPGPGGGGSGGSIVLQAASTVSQAGRLDVSGGAGSPVVFVGFFSCRLLGGDASPGFIRLERAGTAPTVGEIGTTVPAATANNVGLLNEHDDRVGFQGLWASTNEAFPPIFVRYEIDADVDGVATLFSDDPAIGTQALEGSAPLNFYVQGADIDPLTGEPAANTNPSPWRKYVGGFGAGSGESGLNSDAPTGLRYALVFDRTLANNVVVHSVRIIYRS